MTSHCLCGLSFTTNWHLIKPLFLFQDQRPNIVVFLYLPVESSSLIQAVKGYQIVYEKSACSIVSDVFMISHQVRKALVHFIDWHIILYLHM